LNVFKNLFYLVFDALVKAPKSVY